MTNHNGLSRRERQILDILFRRGRATAAEVHTDLTDRPSYSAVRAHLRTLEEKGHVKHEAEALRYVYTPTTQPGKARKSALRHLVETFFNGSPANAAAALLDSSASRLSDEELDQLSALIEKARKEGR
ncbi:MAG TPA: BlaI/MecI/CopY family transcriptional regulator [Bryobacteraceae bacterium]|nr:BlaI/MecI/CopY family transcriptional regulator [Bryobacteraceae bacterium]